MQVEIRRMNNDFHQIQNYQKINEYQFINSMFFGTKKKETTPIDSIDDIGIERYLTDKHLLSAADFYFSLKFEVESFTYYASLNQHPKTIIIPPPEFL